MLMFAFGRVIVASVQPSKAELPMMVRLVQSDRSILVKPVQPPKASVPMVVRLVGRSMRVKPLQSLKTYCLMAVRPVQPERSMPVNVPCTKRLFKRYELTKKNCTPKAKNKVAFSLSLKGNRECFKACTCFSATPS